MRNIVNSLLRLGLTLELLEYHKSNNSEAVNIIMLEYQVKELSKRVRQRVLQSIMRELPLWEHINTSMILRTWDATKDKWPEIVENKP